MRTLLAFLLVNGVLAGANVTAAAVVWFAGNGLLLFFPSEADNLWAWYGIGAAAVAAALIFIVAALRVAQPGAKS